MSLFFQLAFLFMVGSVGGWVSELFFRRFVSMKKWINPGFLNGPYLPMYGVGTVILYGACFIPLDGWWLVLFLTFALTFLEYVTGLIFIKGMKIKLWDYSNRPGNIQGIICPLFTLIWGAVSALFVFLLYEPLKTAAVWSSSNGWMIFAIGIFYGVFAIDLCISFNVSLKIRAAAKQISEAVHYEQLKAYANERRAARKEKLRFLFPFVGEQFSDAVRVVYDRSKMRIRNIRVRGDKNRGSSSGSAKNAETEGKDEK